jgi:hypothetical protein
MPDMPHVTRATQVMFDAGLAQLACGGIVGKSGQGPAPAGAGQGAWRA